MLDSVPLVAITGNVPFPHRKGQLSGNRHHRVTLPITKHNFSSPRWKIADDVREAFRIARSGRRGPVLVDIPKDVQTAKCEFEPKAPALAEIRKAKESEIDRAAEHKQRKAALYLHRRRCRGRRARRGDNGSCRKNRRRYRLLPHGADGRSLRL